MQFYIYHIIYTGLKNPTEVEEATSWRMDARRLSLADVAAVGNNPFNKNDLELEVNQELLNT